MNQIQTLRVALATCLSILITAASLQAIEPVLPDAPANAGSPQSTPPQQRRAPGELPPMPGAPRANRNLAPQLPAPAPLPAQHHPIFLLRGPNFGASGAAGSAAA